MFMYGCFDSMSSVNQICVVPKEAKRGKRILSRMGITESCELPYACWEANLDFLEEQPELLTTEPALKTPFYLKMEFHQRKGPVVLC